MVKVIGPALSLDASKSFGKTMTYQRCPSGTRMYLYKKPGDRVSFIPSWKQRNQRGIGGLILARWQSMTAVEQAVWNDEVRSTGFPGSGYNLFYKKAQTNLYYYLGLCGYWSFNEGSGCRTLDLSGQGNHGDLKPTCPSDSPLWADSQNEKFGKAMQFDGNNDYVNCGTGNSLNLIGSLTLSFWIKTASTASTYIIHRYLTGGNYHGYGLMINRSGSGKFDLYTDGGGWMGAINTTAVNNNKWHHVAITGTGTVGKAYIDGKLDKNFTYAGPDSNPTNTLYLAVYAASLYYFTGILDEVRIFNRALPDLEIFRHYQMFRKSY